MPRRNLDPSLPMRWAQCYLTLHTAHRSLSRIPADQYRRRYLVSERLLAKRREVCPFDEATAILAILAKALVAFVLSFNSWALCALAGLLDAQRTTPPRQRTAPPVHPFALAAAIWLHILLPDSDPYGENCY